MADQNRERELDDMLDSLLSQYAAAEPRPGLETKVFARIAESRRRNGSRARSLWWMVAGGGLAASAAALVMMLLVFRTAQAPPFSGPQAQNGHTEQMVNTANSAPERSLVSAAKRRIHIRKTIPVRAGGNRGKQSQDAALAERPAVFPTPVPLTEQERLMFTYVANTPRQEVVAQIKSKDEKEAAAFWAQTDPLPRRRSVITR